MRLLPDFELERFYLLRRIELIDTLQDFAQDEFYKDDPEEFMNKDDIKIKLLTKYYADVLNPCDVEKTLKRIYPSHLYAPKEENNTN